MRGIGLGLLLAVAVIVPAAPAIAQPAPPVVVQPHLPFPVPPAIPEFDRAFYAPPAEKVAATEPGQIIAARQVTLANLSVLPLNVDAWQVSFRSNNSRMQPIPAVATLIKPRGAAPPGGRKLVSFQMAEDSLGQYCAPSYALRLASIPGLITGQAVVPAEFLQVQTMLQQGWAVVIPDYQGPNSAYAASHLLARITLDGIRAAENFAPLGLAGRATPVGMYGYSGGSIATGHAAEQQAAYAPELNIAGAAEGGVVADFGVMVDHANSGLPSGLIAAAAIGVSREDPELAAYFDRHLNPLGRFGRFIKDQPICTTYEAVTLPFINLKGLVNVPDVMNDPIIRGVLARTRMGQATPRTPMYIFHSNPDWAVPVRAVNATVDTYCRDPAARVHYTRDHFSEHGILAAVATPSVLLWLRDRLNGIPVAPGCTTFDAGTMALDPRTWPLWVSMVGETIAGLFGKAIGRR